MKSLCGYSISPILKKRGVSMEINGKITIMLLWEPKFKILSSMCKSKKEGKSYLICGG